jgi:hypothetical protein
MKYTFTTAGGIETTYTNAELKKILLDPEQLKQLFQSTERITIPDGTVFNAVTVYNEGIERYLATKSLFEEYSIGLTSERVSTFIEKAKQAIDDGKTSDFAILLGNLETAYKSALDTVSLAFSIGLSQYYITDEPLNVLDTDFLLYKKRTVEKYAPLIDFFCNAGYYHLMQKESISHNVSLSALSALVKVANILQLERDA